MVFLVNLFYSFELFKKYCGDFNVPKNESLFLELFSSENSWLFEEGLNIMILENKNKKNYINCPLIEDPKDIYNSQKPISFIYKYENIYEPIIVVQAKQDESLTYISQISNDPVIKINQELKSKITDLFEVINEKGNCNIDMSKKSVYDLLNKSSGNIKYLLFDQYMKGLGVYTKDNIIIFTLSFGLVIKDTLKKLDINDIAFKQFSDLEDELKPYSYVIDKLPFNKRKHQLSLIVKDIEGNDRVTGILLEDNFIHPLKLEIFDKKTHPKNRKFRLCNWS